MQGSIIPTTVDSSRGLRFASGSVSTSASNQPTSGQTLVATSPTTATWQTTSAGVGGGNFTGLGITGNPTTYLTGSVALISSGGTVLAYSGNNIIIGSTATTTVINTATGEPLKSDVISIASGIQTVQVNYGYTYTGIPAVVGIINNTGTNVSGFVAHIPVTFVNQTQSGALAVLASATPSGNYTLDYSLIPSNSNSINGSITLLDPRNISGCVLWLDVNVGVFSDAGTTLAVSGDLAQQWNDQSGSGNNATQSTSAFRPTYITNAVDGYSAIRFNGDNTFLSISNTSDLSQPQMTFFGVSTHESNNTSGRYLISKAPQLTGYGLSFGTNIIRFDASGILSSVGRIQSRPMSNLTTIRKFSVLMGRAGRTVESLSFNGSGDRQVENSYNGCSITAGDLGIGASPTSGGYNLSGNMAEIIIYKRAITDIDVMRVMDYLSTKYSIYS